LHRWRPAEAWPDVAPEALLADLERWLAPHLEGVTRRAHLARLDLRAILAAQLDGRLHPRLEEGAPARLRVPGGARIALRYAPGEAPVMAPVGRSAFGGPFAEVGLPIAVEVQVRSPQPGESVHGVAGVREPIHEGLRSGPGRIEEPQLDSRRVGFCQPVGEGVKRLVVVGGCREERGVSVGWRGDTCTRADERECGNETA